VVQAAQCQPVVRLVRAVEREPPYVGGVDADGRAEDLAVEPAEGALPVPCLDDRLAPEGDPGVVG